MENQTCLSCGKRTTNKSGSAIFPCPNCGKTTIVRCLHCRQIARKYKCPECGFEGPN
ncbi:MAG: zinc finger domain-containing protein [Candidatus Woesearchaeota archaeon]